MLVNMYADQQAVFPDLGAGCARGSAGFDNNVSAQATRAPSDRCMMAATVSSTVTCRRTSALSGAVVEAAAGADGFASVLAQDFAGRAGYRARCAEWGE